MCPYQLPQQLVVLQANALAGNPASAALEQAPPFHNADIDTYQHGDVLRLIEFYTSHINQSNIKGTKNILTEEKTFLVVLLK